FVGTRLAGQRHREQRASMKSVFKTDYCRPFGESACDFDRILDSFGARIQQDGFLREIPRGERIQFFSNSDVAFVWRDREAEMQVLLELLTYCRQYAMRAVPNVQTTDAPGEVQEAIAIDVFQGRTFRA